MSGNILTDLHLKRFVEHGVEVVLHVSCLLDEWFVESRFGEDLHHHEGIAATTPIHAWKIHSIAHWTERKPRPLFWSQMHTAATHHRQQMAETSKHSIIICPEILRNQP